MSWDERIIYLIVTVAILLITAVVFAIIRRRRPNGNGVALFTRVERWVWGVFATILAAALIYITVRYS
jgi:hypothetical protein